MSGTSRTHEAHILVVEDNVSNFVLIARMLGFLGIHCEWKTSGYEVVEYADTLPKLDLILMDIRLPYEDGYGALKKMSDNFEWYHGGVRAIMKQVNRKPGPDSPVISGIFGPVADVLNPDPAYEAALEAAM